MKKIAIIQLLVLSLNQCWSQGVVTYKEIDYITDNNIIYSDKEKINSKVGIKINNINKRLVDINKDIQKTSFNEEVPKLFGTFSGAKAPDASAAGAGLLAAQLVLLDPDDLAAANIPEGLRGKLISLKQLYFSTGNEINDKRDLLKLYGADFSHLKSVLTYHTNLQALQNVCNETFNNIITDVNTLTKSTFTDLSMNIAVADKALLLGGSDITTNRAIINRYITNTVTEAQKHYDDINSAFHPSGQDKLNKNVESIKKEIINLETALKLIVHANDNTKALIKSLTAEKINAVLENDFKDLNHVYEKYDFEKLQKNIETFESTGKTELFNTYDYFNVSNYTYYVNPELIDKDLTVISVDIAPKENVVCSPIPRSYSLRIRSKGGVKIDFSSGLFANFGGNDFKDQSYRLDAVVGDPDKYIINRNEGKNTFFPSVGALMHIYKRNGKDFNYSGTFGISTKDLEKINYHLGGSLIFGYSQRFIISAGVTMTKANLIDDKYKVGQIIEKAGAPETIPTSSFNRFGYFFALTYNLSAK